MTAPAPAAPGQFTVSLTESSELGGTMLDVMLSRPMAAQITPATERVVEAALQTARDALEKARAEGALARANPDFTVAAMDRMAGQAAGRAVPALQQTIANLDKALANHVEAVRDHLRKAAAPPTDAVSALRQQELRQAFAALEPQERVHALHAQPFDLELFGALLHGPRFVTRLSDREREYIEARLLEGTGFAGDEEAIRQTRERVVHAMSVVRTYQVQKLGREGYQPPVQGR